MSVQLWLLVEGRLLMAPSPVPDHNHAISQLILQLVAIEVLSPGSRRTDQIVARGEYADA